MIRTSSVEQTAVFARVLAAHVQAGDVILLTGNLGAGKTTLTQMIGKELNVRGRITSPTFVIAREHEAVGDGPGLVHVDAYRLEDAMELDDLDLDAELDDMVTIIEWGRGKAEQLSDSYLDIFIDRPESDPESEARTYTLSAHGPRWEGRIEQLTTACQEAL